MKALPFELQSLEPMNKNNVSRSDSPDDTRLLKRTPKNVSNHLCI